MLGYSWQFNEIPAHKQQSIQKYSQLWPCGHLAITDTPIIRTAAKSPVKTNYRRLTEINSRYYGLSRMRTLARGPQQCPLERELTVSTGGAIDERERGFIEPTYSPIFQILGAKSSRILNPNYWTWDDTYYYLNASYKAIITMLSQMRFIHCL